MSGSGLSGVALLDALRDLEDGVDVAAMDDAERLALLRASEELTRALAALSVRIQVAFAHSQVEQQAAAGIPVRKRGLAVADDIAAARKTSPSLGSRDLTSAKALVHEMPLTLQALANGTISAYQARIITEATTCLEEADRAEVDERLQSALPGASNAEIGKAVRALVYELDPAGFVNRARRAAKDRGVSVRPAPDVMALLSARLPAPQAIACYQALRSHALAARASGDPRTLNQLMADELCSRLTGRTVVDGIDVEVGLVMTDAALLDGASDAADLDGYGPIPAEMARDLLRQQSTSSAGEDDTDAAADVGAADQEHCPDGARCASWDCAKLHGVASSAPTTPASDLPEPPPEPDESAARTPAEPSTDAQHSPDTARAAKAWVRRLYADPVTGVLAGRDPRRRLFTGALRAFLIARDRTCRNSWCGAPIRDIDHIRRHRDGGTTDPDNGRGLCQRCNLARDRERHHDPPPESYRPPPPAATTLLGRQLPGAPVPAAPAQAGGTAPPPSENGENDPDTLDEREAA